MTGLTSEQLAHKAQHAITITNSNSVDLRDVECRVQLPEPIAEPPQIKRAFVGPAARFRALAAANKVVLSGTGASVQYLDPQGRPLANAPAAPSYPIEDQCARDDRYTAMACPSLFGPVNTGTWQLQLQTLPARKSLVIEFVTSDDQDAQHYIRELRQASGLTTFVDCTVSFESDSHMDAKRIFVPINFEPATRTLSSGRADIGLSRAPATKFIFGVPHVPVWDADKALE